jgi:hypothetical protein
MRRVQPLAAELARRLVEAVEIERAAVARGERGEPLAVYVDSPGDAVVTLSARLSWRRERLTGGVILLASAATGAAPVHVERRLKPGSSYPQMYRHAAQMVEAVCRVGAS